MNGSITRRLATAAGALLVMLGLGIFVATPAHAVSVDDCPSGRLCLFEDSGYDGDWVYTLAAPTSGSPCITISSAFWGQVSSVYNRTTKRVILYSDACTRTTGTTTSFDAGQRAGFGTWQPRHFMNDLTKSVWFV